MDGGERTVILRRLSRLLFELGLALQPREYRERLTHYMILAYRMIPEPLLRRWLGWVVRDAVVLCATEEPTEDLILRTYHEARAPDLPRAGSVGGRIRQ